MYNKYSDSENIYKLNDNLVCNHLFSTLIVGILCLSLFSVPFKILWYMNISVCLSC